MSRYDTFWPGSCPPPIMPPSPTAEQITAKRIVRHLKYDAFSGASPAYEEIHFADGTVIGVVTNPTQQ